MKKRIYFEDVKKYNYLLTQHGWREQEQFESELREKAKSMMQLDCSDVFIFVGRHYLLCGEAEEYVYGLGYNVEDYKNNIEFLNLVNEDVKDILSKVNTTAALYRVFHYTNQLINIQSLEATQWLAPIADQRHHVVDLFIYQRIVDMLGKESQYQIEDVISDEKFTKKPSEEIE